MKEKDKKVKQSKHSYPKTIGTQVLSFAQEKLNFLIESVYRVSKEEILIPRFKTLRKLASRSKGDLINRREEHPDFIYFRPLVLLNLEDDRTKDERFRPDQGKIQPLKKVLNFDSHSSDFSNTGKRQIKTKQHKGDQGVTLSPKILSLFSRWLKIKLPSVQLHQNEMADRLLRQRHADAMTVGTDIYFRKEKYDIKNARGLGLLAHELTHVAQQYRSNWGNQAFGHHSEKHEKSAIDNERLILANAHAVSQRNDLSPHIDVMANSGSPSTPLSATESGAPMFANTSRDIGEAPSTALTELRPAGLSDSDKEEIYRDLMMRIKVDFERGS